MRRSFFHTTEKDNLYIYDDRRRLSMLAHPELKKADEKKTDVDYYYLKKYKYLSDHGFFSESQPITWGTINDSLIKNSITNTPQILFEVTDSCNLSCTYCGYGELYGGYEQRNKANINADAAKKLLKHILGLKYKGKTNKVFIGFYGGEPLLNIKFIKEIVAFVNEIVSKKELQIEYAMTTNGTLIHKHIQFLVENKFLMTISLDGNQKNHSYRIFSKTRKNSFSQIIKNVDFIQNDYPDYFAHCVDFNAVLHNRNSVQDIYEFIYSRYNKIPMISELALRDIRPDKQEYFAKMFHSKIQSESEYREKEFNLLPTLYGDLFYSEVYDFFKYLSINSYVSNIVSLLKPEEKYFPTNTCLPFSRKIFLTNRNKILPCERISSRHALGKVAERVMIDTSMIVQQYNFYYNHLKQVCQFCYAYRFCGLCLFHFENLDKIGTEEFTCNRFSDLKSFQNKLYNTFSILEKYPQTFFQILENER